MDLETSLVAALKKQAGGQNGFSHKKQRMEKKPCPVGDFEYVHASFCFPFSAASYVSKDTVVFTVSVIISRPGYKTF